jgi:hypothetical protein
MNRKVVYPASCVCLLIFMTTAQADLKTDWEAAIKAGNPLHWYKFDEAGSTDCLDSGSGALNGQYEAVQPAQEGLLGPSSAAVFTRTGANRAYFAGAANLPGPWTAEYIVKTTKAPAGNDSQVLHDSDTTSIRLAGWTSLGEPGFTAYGVADYQFTPSAGLALGDLVIPQNQWVHLVWRNKNGTQMFLNGELVGTSSSSIDLPRLAIGGRGAGPVDMLQGVLDEAVVYNRALSDQDIVAHASLAGLAPVQARNPDPADGATGVGTPFFQWKAGIGAKFHDFYIGTSPDLTSDNLAGNHLFVALQYYTGVLEPGVVYYWRVDEVAADGVTVYTGDVWHFTVTPLSAYGPVPRNGDKWIASDAALTWQPGNMAISHELYFGTDKEAVTNRDAGVSKGKLANANYDPGALAEQTTYYWAVDEVTLTGKNAGETWSFTTTGAGGGVKGEYFNGMTLSGAPALTRIDPSIDFNWGTESPGAPVGVDQFSVRWTADLEIAVADTYTFISNTDDGARLWLNDRQIINRWVDQAATDTVSQPIMLEPGIYPLRMEYYDAGSAAVAHLFWQTPTLAREIIPAGPLQPPVRARAIYPPNGDVNVPQDLTLRWSAGENAARHQIYFGDDAAAVAAADTSSSLYQGQQNLDETTFTPPTLEWNKTYSWRIDEVNDASPDSPWVGPVWSFTTADYLVIDDMESYNDEEDQGTRIYETWIDGYSDGSSGSTVGNLDPPFAEQTIVHGGKQSMPMDYNNINSPYFSEAYREFSPLQDWTVHGVTDLSLWVRGQPIRLQVLADDHIVMSSTSGDVWDVVDHFRYVFKKLTGDGIIIAKVESMTNTAGWAKAGVMMRSSLEAGSMHALEMLAPNGRSAFQNRQFNDEPSFSAHGNPSAFTFPHWVKLERKGNQFTAYHSADGVNWTLQADEAAGGSPNPQTINLGNTVYVGLMVTSNNLNQACVAEFSNIQITGSVSGVWQAADVGPAIVGNDLAPLYLAVEDSAGKKVTVVHPDAGVVNVTAWTEWKIPLTDLAGVNLGKVKRLYLGVGDKANPAPDGYGRIYIDDIRVVKP